MQPIALVKHAAMAGHELVLSHSETINESLYDLFNLRFRYELYFEDINAPYISNGKSFMQSQHTSL